MKKIISCLFAFMLIFSGVLSFTAAQSANAAEFAEESVIENTVYERGGTIKGVFNENISYSYKLENSNFKSNPEMPGYATSYTCGMQAGGNIIAWYNILYPQLIPGHTAGTLLFGIWFWASPNALTDAMFTQLYNDMNPGGIGVTINQYHNGMNKYVSGKGRTYTKTSVMGSNGMPHNFKTHLQSGKLMTVFLYGFNISSVMPAGSNMDNVRVEEHEGAHVMAVYGYREIEYYNAQKYNFRTDLYLYVVPGLGSGLGMIRISSHCTVDDAYITHIT